LLDLHVTLQVLPMSHWKVLSMLKQWAFGVQVLFEVSAVCTVGGGGIWSRDVARLHLQLAAAWPCYLFQRQLPYLCALHYRLFSDTKSVCLQRTSWTWRKCMVIQTKLERKGSAFSWIMWACTSYERQRYAILTFHLEQYCIHMYCSIIMFVIKLKQNELKCRVGLQWKCSKRSNMQQFCIRLMFMFVEP
jgi:hypothetical protein